MGISITCDLAKKKEKNITEDLANNNRKNTYDFAIL